MKKLEHIGIAVEDLDAAERIFGDILGSPAYKREEVMGESVLTSFFQSGESKVELLVPTSPESAIARHLDPSCPFDVDGLGAARGRVVEAVVERLLADPYYAAPPPKSTGRERFGRAAAEMLLHGVREAGGSDDDALATATAYTAHSVATQLTRWLPPADDADVVVSGGGAKNPTLMAMLRAAMHPRPVTTFTEVWFDGDAKEAASFAYLGWRTVQGRAGNVPSATGASGSRVLGVISRPLPGAQSIASNSSTT